MSPKKIVKAKGAPAAPSKMVFVLKHGAFPTMVKQKACLVVCGNFLPQVSDTATQNLGVTAMRLTLPWGFVRGYRERAMAFPNTDLKGWERVLTSLLAP